MPLFTRLRAALLALLPSGVERLRPGVSDAAQVRACLGEPDAEYRHPDGSLTWEYSRQPQGCECHMVSLGPDRVVRRVEQVLAETGLARVAPGLERAQVRRLLGRPATVQSFERQGEEIWDWHIRGDHPLEDCYFQVHFDTGSGRVLRTSRRTEMRG